MPEGHTIHRIARDLGRLLAGRPVRVTSPQGRFEAGAAVVDGQVLERYEAYGKHLFTWWSSGHVGHVHLGLFGKHRIHRGEVPEPRPTVRMRLESADDGPPVAIDLTVPTACSVGTPDDRDLIVRRLGPDPLRADAEPARFVERAGRSSKAIGALLLDQSVIAGIGNVYRAEILFLCGIDPRRPSRTLSDAEFEELWSTTVELMRIGVRMGRIVTTDPAEIGRPRSRMRSAERLYVYHQQHCRRCGTELLTVEVGGRPISYCPVHQT